MQKACLLFLAATPIFAQSSTIRGQITDESGAVVPKARITLTGSGSVRTADSDNLGSYVVSGLTPGDYEVSASAPDLSSQPVHVRLTGSPLTVNLILKVTATTQHVTVLGQTGPTVSTDPSNNASGLILRGDDLLALSDDPDDLAADLQALAGPSAGPSGGSFFVDGFSGGDLPPKDSIREIRINQNPFAPEYDKLGYGKIEIFTKPGSDRYHANLNYNIGTAWWNSRNPFSAEKAPFLLNEFENSGGGPLGKRASFTLDFQHNMVDNGFITNGVMLNSSFLSTPFTEAYVGRQRLTRVSPRVDYALNANNTLSVRYTFTNADVPGEGVGNLDLPSRGYDYSYDNQTVQVTETAVLGAAVNESRFQFFRSAVDRTAYNSSPEIQVLGAFDDGGASVGAGFDRQNNYELQNYTTIAHGTHLIKFGARLRGQTDDNFSPQNFNGTFTFGGGLAPVLDANNQAIPGDFENIDSIESYRRTLLNLAGGGPSQFSINAGNPELYLGQFDAGIFAGDDWRVGPNITLSYGLRYEWQTNIRDYRDWAPRLGIAWAPAIVNGNKNSPKTVLRLGVGTFYDRFALANTLTADRYNGKVQQSYIVTDPTFFPENPPISTLASFQSAQSIQEVDSNLRAPYILQSAITLEHQLPAHTTVALTYTNSHGLHELRSADINAPLPGTYTGVPNSGIFPFGTSGPVLLMESSGLYNQNQLIANVNSRVNSAFSLFGFYVFNKAMSNTDGIGTFPANPYNFAGEYGPAATDIRHRVTLGGSITTRWNIRLSPYFIVQSGMPFDITSGNDPYGTTLFTARPGIPADPNKPGLIDTAYGLLDPNPTPGEQTLTRNSGLGPGQISMNLRIGKTIGFGGEKGSKAADTPPAGNPGNTATAATGRGLGSLIQAPNTSRRYNLTISMSIRNLLNHTNPGPIEGDITSPLFGKANQIAGTPNGEGFWETANNRRLEMQIRFTF
jgi:Carboxypeptidase regulatory-like domain